jgi:hypothetical protein
MGDRTGGDEGQATGGEMEWQAGVAFILAALLCLSFLWLWT